MSITREYVGVGIYTFGQAARLLRVRPNLLQYWIGERPGVDSIVKRQFEDERLITFAELMELHFVKLFRDENVSFHAIRKAASEAAKKFNTDYPFTVKRFDTDGKSIFATLKSKETDHELIEEMRHGQLVFNALIKPFFKKLDYHGTAEIERFWPMQKNGRVVLDPSRKFGKPIDFETGISTDVLFNSVNAGGGQDEQVVAQWFDIPLEAVQAAVRYERTLAT